MPSRHSAEDLGRRLDEVASMSAEQIRPRWTEIFGKPPSPHLSTALLRAALAHELQARAFGGLRPTVLRRLQRLAADPCIDRSRSQLKPGSRLLREWLGKTHVVEVLDEGFRWQGTTYRSLSRVAEAITGTHWSGPRFFGMRHDQHSDSSAER